MKKIVLASKSPRRKELLENIGVKFSVIVTDADESAVPKDLEPGLYVRELSLIKATEAARYAEKNSYVIGADTVVVYDGQILGKPKDRDDAIKMLTMLSGKDHYVYTGITVTDADTMESVSEYEKTVVSFKELTSKEIEYYTDNYNVLDKAGSYGIQEFAGRFVKGLQGDYFNVVGLPVCRLCLMFSKEFGEELI